MNIRGYAFQEDEKERQLEFSRRYKEISHLHDQVKINKSPKYGSVDFRGEILSEEAISLSELDLALLADFGNLCFGGNCTKTGKHFHGTYFTD